MARKRMKKKKRGGKSSLYRSSAPVVFHGYKKALGGKLKVMVSHHGHGMKLHMTPTQRKKLMAMKKKNKAAIMTLSKRQLDFNNMKHGGGFFSKIGNFFKGVYGKVIKPTYEAVKPIISNIARQGLATGSQLFGNAVAKKIPVFGELAAKGAHELGSNALGTVGLGRRRRYGGSFALVR